MAFASLEEDINIQLPEDKIEVDPAEYDGLQLDAERIVRGYLSGYIDSAVIASWISPDTTPGLIRAIAGRLVAAFQYRRRYSEDSLDDPQFAKIKYDEAILWLSQIQNGTMVIDGVVVAGGQNIEETDFWPNDTTDPAPIFTMNMQL